jgi:hypothetical protein
MLREAIASGITGVGGLSGDEATAAVGLPGGEIIGVALLRGKVGPMPAFGGFCRLIAGGLGGPCGLLAAGWARWARLAEPSSERVRILGGKCPG